MNEKQLFLEDGKPTKAWYCTQCNHVHHNQEMAAKCCAPYTCNICGAECDKYWTQCNSCRQAERDKKDAETLTKAQKLESWDGWVYFEGFSSGCGEGYFQCISDLADSLLDHEEDEGPIAWPEYVYVCVERPFGVTHDAGELADDALDNLELEDTDHLSVEGKRELQIALDAFDEMNKHIVAYHVDTSRAVKFPTRAEMEAK